VVRGNLLRIIKSICEAIEDQGALLRKYGLYDAIERLSESDPAILVRNMAADLIKASEISTSVRSSGDSSRFRPLRRSSSSATSTSLFASSPQMSPAHLRQPGQSSYFDTGMEYNVGRPRSARPPAATPLRPPSVHESSTIESMNTSSESTNTPVLKSRLPRTSIARRLTTSRREENNRPPPTPPPPVPAIPTTHRPIESRKAYVVNQRRKRPTSSTNDVHDR
jgi:hypothetical protein